MSELLTGEGNPVMGDSEICPTCGEWMDYASDDVFLCFGCLGNDPDDDGSHKEDDADVDDDDKSDKSEDEQQDEDEHQESEEEDAEEELTGEGNPVMGDSERCEGCGFFKDYLSEDVYMCFACDTGNDGEDDEPPEDEDHHDAGAESEDEENEEVWAEIQAKRRRLQH